MKNDKLAYALETVLDNLHLLDKEMLDKLEFALWVVQQERIAPMAQQEHVVLVEQQERQHEYEELGGGDVV